MQVILDSLFARPGSAPIGGGKEGEFRDWTNSEDISDVTSTVTQYSWLAKSNKNKRND